MAFRFLLLTACLVAPIRSARTQSSPPARWAPLLGEWTGVAERRPDAGPPVSVRLRIEATPDSARVMLSLPESRLIDLAIPSPYSDSTTVSLRGDSLRVEFTPDIGLAILSGLGIPREEERIGLTLVRGGDQLVGRIRITTYESPVVLRRLPTRSDPREPAITFYSIQDSLRLAGKLVLPQGRGPFPAIVWVTGSDPDTREAWQYEARTLAELGLASLLYDKRGVGESVGASHDLDVEGALRYLRSRPGLIDPRRLGLVGQSQGTWILAKVAARGPGVHFLVNLSGSGVSAAEQETYRTGALMRRAGFDSVQIARAVDFQRRKFEVARTGLGWPRLDSLMQQLRRDSVPWFPNYGTGAAIRSLAQLRLYGVLQFNYSPTRDLERIRVPTLVLMGARDVVFPPEVVIQRMRAALERAGNSDLTTLILPGVSHGMSELQTAGGKAFRWAISPRFLDELTRWIPARATRAGSR